MISWRDRLTKALPQAAVVLHDLLMVWVCWQLLHAGRYSMLREAPDLPLWDWRTAVVLVAQGLVFWKMGLYRGLWRFASVPDLWNIFKSSFLGLVAIVVQPYLQRGELQPLFVSDLGSTAQALPEPLRIYLCVADRRDFTPKVRAFMEHVLERLPVQWRTAEPAPAPAHAATGV